MRLCILMRQFCSRYNSGPQFLKEADPGELEPEGGDQKNPSRRALGAAPNTHINIQSVAPKRASAVLTKYSDTPDFGQNEEKSPKTPSNVTARSCMGNHSKVPAKCFMSVCTFAPFGRRLPSAMAHQRLHVLRKDVKNS
jgi:hypothetical protein